MGSPEVGCRHVLAHLWQYIDQEIDRTFCAQVEAHLAICSTCRQWLEFDQKTKRLVRRCEDDPVPRERVEALVIQVRRRIVGETRPGD
jgi:mycothiol system anti-sigma-R factor